MNYTTSLNNDEICTSWDTIWSQDYQMRWLNIIEQNDSHVFLHPILLKTWYEFNKKNSILPFFIYIENSLGTLFWPLVLYRTAWTGFSRKILKPAGANCFDYQTPICTDDVLFLSALNTIENTNYDSFQISNILERYFSLLNHQQISRKQTNNCPYIVLDEFSSGEAFIRKRRKSLSEDIRRQLRRMNEIGEICFENVPELENEKELIKMVQCLKSVYPEEKFDPTWYSAFLKNDINKELVDFTRLTINGQSIAWHFGFRWKRRFYYYRPAYDSEYSNYSPGKILLYKLLDMSISKGDQIFDFLRGAESYKSSWTDLYNTIFSAEQNRNKFISHIKNNVSRIQYKTIITAKKVLGKLPQ